MLPQLQLQAMDTQLQNQPRHRHVSGNAVITYTSTTHHACNPAFAVSEFIV
jgi:hypothetical protein